MNHERRIDICERHMVQANAKRWRYLWQTAFLRSVLERNYQRTVEQTEQLERARGLR